MRLQSLLLAISLASVAGVVSAKNLYVHATDGNDSVTYAQNDASRPWRSLGRAVWGSTRLDSMNTVEAAKAGDTVIVSAGIYETSGATDSRYTPIYNTANSGTASAPIRIVADGNVYLRSTQSSGAQPIIGTLGRSHIVWDGFIIDENYVPTRPDTGPVVVWDSNNIVIQNLQVTGVPKTWRDNHGGIRVERSSDITVRNNLIRGFSESHGGGITTYYTRNILIENNEIRDCNDGVFIKGANPGGATVRYNLIQDTKNGIMFGGVGLENLPSFAYQNIVLNSTLAGIIFIGYGDGPVNVTIANNVVYGTTRGGDGGGILMRGDQSGFRNLALHNNIVVNANAGVTAWATNLSAASFSHNNYFNNSRVAYIGYQDHSLSQWRSAFGKDTVGSMTSDPNFISASNFRLAAGSPLRTAGLDVLDLNRNGSRADAVPMGAYITGTEVIGRSATSSPTPRPPGDVAVE